MRLFPAVAQMLKFLYTYLFLYFYIFSLHIYCKLTAGSSAQMFKFKFPLQTFTVHQKKSIPSLGIISPYFTPFSWQYFICDFLNHLPTNARAH